MQGQGPREITLLQRLLCLETRFRDYRRILRPHLFPPEERPSEQEVAGLLEQAGVVVLDSKETI